VDRDDHKAYKFFIFREQWSILPRLLRKGGIHTIHQLLHRNGHSLITVVAKKPDTKTAVIIRFPSPVTMCTLVKMTIRSPLELIRDTRLEKEWSAVANTPAKSNTTLTLMKLKFWTPFTQCFHIMKEAIKISKHQYDLHPEYTLGLRSEQSLGSPSTLLPNHMAPNW
jgi:hypothetical protein